MELVKRLTHQRKALRRYLNRIAERTAYAHAYGLPTADALRRIYITRHEELEVLDWQLASYDPQQSLFLDERSA